MDAIVGLGKLGTISSLNPLSSLKNISKIERQKQHHLLRTRTPKPKPISPPLPSPIISTTPISNSNHLLINSKPSSYTQFKNPETESIINELEPIIFDLQESSSMVVNQETRIDRDIFDFLLTKCCQLSTLDCGLTAVNLAIRIHRLMPDYLLRRDVYLASNLIRLYALGGYIYDAHQVFDNMSDRDLSTYSWNWLISGYVKMGLYEVAVRLYYEMEEKGVEVNEYTVSTVVNACAGLGLLHIGEEVHSIIIRRGFVNNMAVVTGLLAMYVKCGDIVKARKLFDDMEFKDLVIWTSMLKGYIQHDLLADALFIFRCMIQNGHEPDPFAITTMLASGLPLKLAAQIHGWVLRRGAERNLPIANSLVTVYSKNHRLDGARWLFDQMPEKNVTSWNSLISEYVEYGLHEDAVALYLQMEEDGVEVDEFTFSSMLKACARFALMPIGKEVHGKIIRRGFVNNIFVLNGLVDMYAELGLYEDAVALYFQTQKEGVELDEFSFSSVLKACAGSGLMHIGQEVHSKIIRLGFINNMHVLNGLVDMYAKCGDIIKARKMFDKMELKDSVTCTSMLNGYIIFRSMLKNGHELDLFAITAVLASGLLLKLAAQIH